MDKKQHFQEIVNLKMLNNLNNIEKHLVKAKKIFNAELLTIEQKAIRILEEIQEMQFGTDIFRELQNLHK